MAGADCPCRAGRGPTEGLTRKAGVLLRLVLRSEVLSTFLQTTNSA